MRICIYEDAGSAWLEPIALTRPAFALWCGAERLFERQRRQFAASEVGFWMRPELTELWKLDEPGHPVNDADWARERPTVWINGRWLPTAELRIDATAPHVGCMNQQIAYAVLPGGADPSGAVDDWLADWKTRLPQRDVLGTMLDYLWDVVDQNGTAITQDADWFRALHGVRSTASHVVVTGPSEQMVIASGATIEPFVVADTRGGPILIDRDAVVQSFSRLEGPCYIGKDSWIVGGKLRAGSSIGPCSRIGGEIEASIIQGYCNKYHEGFLGHSYLGEWINLAAATQTSDLRNDYGIVQMTINGKRLPTGKSKIGSYVGDHSKTALGTLFNTGSTIGAFVNLLPSGNLLPQVVPSFCQVQHGQLNEIWDLRKTFATAARVMQRRGKTMTDVHRDFYYDLFEATASSRQHTIRENEKRRLRKSV